MTWLLSPFLHQINGNHIYTHVIYKEYAARVNTLHSYGAISRDIMHRWTFPLVPDIFNFEHRTTYKRNNIYQCEGVILGRQCLLDEDVILGHKTRAGTDEGPVTRVRLALGALRGTEGVLLVSFDSRRDILLKTLATLCVFRLPGP